MNFGAEYFRFFGDARFESNVGIGIAIPSQKLDVVGTGKFSAGVRSPSYCDENGANCIVPSSNYMKFTDANSIATASALRSCAQGQIPWYDVGDDDWYCTSVTANETDPQVGAQILNYVPRWNGSALVNGIITDNGTHVGIGSDPTTAMLTVGGNSIFNIGENTNSFVIYNNPTGDTALSVDGENGYIWSQYNLGIGTATPSQKLEVNGIGKFITSIYTPQICDLAGTTCVTVSDIAGLAAAATPGQMPVNTAVTAYALYSASTCSGANKGAVRFSSLNNRFEGCNGTQWVVFTTTNIAVEQPAACSTTTANTCTNGTPAVLPCNGTTAEWTCNASNGSTASCTIANSPTCNAQDGQVGTELCSCDVGLLIAYNQYADPYCSGKYAVNWTCDGINGGIAQSTVDPGAECITQSSIMTACGVLN